MKKLYPSTVEARRRRVTRQRRRPGEPRISALASFWFKLRRLTQQETADLLGISRQRVQQIERNAFHKLRAALRERLGGGV